MSIAELAKLQRANDVLVLDIERMKGQASVEFWSLSDFKNRRIHADDVTAWPRTICAAWAWYDKARYEFASEWDDGAEGMLRRIWEAFDRAQVVVGHNMAGFDIKHLRTGWRDLGLPPPSPVKVVDTLRIARREFGDESKTLDALCRRLGIEAKTDRYDVEVARAALAGNRSAQKRIKAYNLGDIAASIGLYDALRPWDPTHPHNIAGTKDDRATCNSCWGDNLEPNGVKLASQIVYRLFRCLDCGANVQGTRHSRAGITRGAR